MYRNTFLSKEEKQKTLDLIHQDKITIVEAAKKCNVSVTTMRRWVKCGVEPGAQRHVNIPKHKRSKHIPASQPAQKITLREALYNELAEEFKVTEAKLVDLHTKLKFLGEDWNAD